MIKSHLKLRVNCSLKSAAMPAGISETRLKATILLVAFAALLMPSGQRDVNDATPITEYGFHESLTNF
jgi:hypothetical protein